MPESFTAKQPEHQNLTAGTVSRIAAMLDQGDVPCMSGDEVPLGWHFPLLSAGRGDCRARRDRFPGLGLPLPDVDLPRIVAAGREIEFHEPLHIGEQLERQSSIDTLVEKEALAGRLAIMATSHRIASAGSANPAVEEKQTYIFLASPHSDRSAQPWTSHSQARKLGEFTPDDTFLFQFSALSFNSHRIHLDRDYARTVEGYPDLVVNGGITTLLMTEYVRRNLGFTRGKIKVTNSTPLFVNRCITFMVEPTSMGSRISALNSEGVLAVEMEVEIP
ncbi:FAS1-like dehydratase domain-containing protein [Sphingorhabdus sp.]|uniref:FAS1-like dehydratase domain-containing protein n=1 Tax=Sphingorhabdus sp. TaxID=1902408 RepID=UPI002FD8D8A5